MLKTLYIENLAVIEKLTVDFEQGLTVFTGETGAGKSILIDAINLIIGERANKEIVRTGKTKAVVSAVFTDLTPAQQALVEEQGYESENGEWHIMREVGVDSKGSARAMGRPIPIVVLRQIGAQLINIHGQHDNQVLLNEQNHLTILDSFADNRDLFLKYQTEYQHYAEIKRDYKNLQTNEQQKAQRMDLLRYQIDEIETLTPTVGEDIYLSEQLGTMRNSAKITEALNLAYAALCGVEGEGGCSDLVQQAISAVDLINSYHTDLQAVTEQLISVRYDMDDVASKISSFLEQTEFSPTQLEQTENRVAELESLKKKYGPTLEEVLLFCEQAKKELEEIELSEQRATELLLALDKQKKTVMTCGQELSSTRQIAGERFVEEVTEQLAFLDMPNVRLQVSFEKAKYGARGCDEVAFLFSTNKGENVKSIGKIASGGELSRIMLAIKNVLADKDDIQTLIFDEVDTGVSGQSAQKIGLKLKSVSAGRQVLCVTHSAQIAALAHHNFLIRKETDDNRTFTRIFPLDFDGKVQEVARIMATDKITDLMLETAKSMILSQNS